MHRLPSKNLHYKTSAISLFIIRLPIAFIVSYLGKLRLVQRVPNDRFKITEMHMLSTIGNVSIRNMRFY